MVNKKVDMVEIHCFMCRRKSMKINPETRRQDLALYVTDHLSPIPSDQAKWGTAVLIFVLYDLPLFLCLVGIYKVEFIWFSLPFVLIIHLWLIRILVKNVYSTQVELVLFMGCWSLLSFISLIILFFYWLYYEYEITSIVTYIIFMLMTIILVYIFVRYQLKRYADDPTKEKRVSNQYQNMGIVTAVPGVAYLSTVITGRIGSFNDILRLI